MERINLVTTEKARELSRLNNRLYECVLQEEARPAQDNVISHVIIKADVRGSTRMTQDLLDRKSTRLNSSHGYISYAVFCLKKKTKTITLIPLDPFISLPLTP